jgi:hypothetical protein
MLKRQYFQKNELYKVAIFNFFENNKINKIFIVLFPVNLIKNPEL